ncbi:MAG: hypothetical protein Q9205_004247 [Flavoplaca limonia]
METIFERPKLFLPSLCVNLQPASRITNGISATSTVIGGIEKAREGNVFRHHQLKNFISTADHDIIYYACENDIYALHLSTCKREAIASLPWKIQCLDARYGWICVGGPDKGRCAFVCIDRNVTGSSHDRYSTREAEVDALLPLDLDPDSRTLAQSYFRRLRASSSPSRGKPEVQIHELAASTANSITNSVAIHRLRTGQKGRDDEIVCVMTYV